MPDASSLPASVPACLGGLSSSRAVGPGRILLTAMDTKDNVRPAIARMPRVLVVEDHADTLIVLGKMLMKIPADAIPVASCADARHASATHGPFDVVIADMKL